MEKSKQNICAGCQAETSGVKSRVAIPHTCGKGSDRPRPRGLKVGPEYINPNLKNLKG